MLVRGRLCAALSLLAAGGFGCKSEVPDVTTQSQADATAMVVNAGLAVGVIVQYCSNDIPAGHVITQHPVAGTRVRRGSSIDLDISTGPCPVITTVPDLSGMNQADAEDAISAAGLALGTVNTACSNTTAADRVASQSPAAGTSVTAASIVNITLSSGPCPVITTVPDLSGMNQADAENAITVVGLALGTVTTACSNTVAAGRISGQSPAVGTSVTAGTAVNIVLSSGACVEIPDLIGASQSDAVTALLSLGFIPVLSTGCDNEVPAGSVADQDPAAGSQVPENTMVFFSVSTGSCPVIIPDLTGFSLVYAESLLNSLGLATGVTTTLCNNSYAQDTVTAQIPGAGTVVLPGTSVDLVVSTGPCPVAVPNLVGMTRSDAENALTAVGLQPEYPSYTCSLIIPLDHIALQDPAAGSLVLPGTSVYFSLATGGCDDPITIADSRLNEILRELYGITDPATPLTRQQLLGLSSLDIPGEGITSLSGLETARNLQTLYVSNNSIADLSPLAGLDILRHLDIENNQVTDLSPLALGITFSKPSDFLPKVLACTGNPLSSDSINIYIPQLTARGVNVTYVLKNLR